MSTIVDLTENFFQLQLSLITTLNVYYCRLDIFPIKGKV